MTDVVIQVENLSKRYRIGARQQGYRTLRETLVDAAMAPVKRIARRNRKSGFKDESDDEVWALKDVSFDINQGEVVGVIGRNGAGKSTLLKILSRITEPTTGRIEMRGRVGSLLEVGTGFHPELTGHENIYLYGAILGMDRWEVTRKFDAIVAFSQLERFIDTPVKRYSSGMYMRLAFAVAAHMETEILLVDEVLSVGDIEFQEKCLRKINDVTNEGRTVIFVSHHLASLGRICQKGIRIDSGTVKEIGSIQSVINGYLETVHQELSAANTFQSKDIARFETYLEDPAGARVSSVYMDDPFSLVMDVTPALGMYFTQVHLQMRIHADDGLHLSSICTPEIPGGPFDLKGRRLLRLDVRNNPLLPGTYDISVRLRSLMLSKNLIDISPAIRVTVVEKTISGAADAYTAKHGFIFFNAVLSHTIVKE